MNSKTMAELVEKLPDTVIVDLTVDSGVDRDPIPHIVPESPSYMQ